MISVGIDVSKEKSTVCILKPHGEIISKPFEIQHIWYPINWNLKYIYNVCLL